MTKLKQVFKCNVCGNIVEVLHQGEGELVCCNQPMELMKEKEKEEGFEKHLPVILELPANVCQGKDGYEITVNHPMEKDHYIEWIEINTIEGKSGKKFLKNDEKPTVNFYTRKKIESVRVYCNVHGLWKKDV